MAREISISEEYRTGLYDVVTGKKCVTEKVVDVTVDCPSASDRERALLLFTRDRNGRIVQICRPYEGEVCMGSCIHFFVDMLNREMRMAPRDDTFGSTARDLGLSKEKFRTLIEMHAPVA